MYSFSDVQSEPRTCLRFAESTFFIVLLECRGDTICLSTTELREGRNFTNFISAPKKQSKKHRH